MSVFIQFKSWSGKDATVAIIQLSKVFKLKGKQSETVMDLLTQGRTWKYGTPVAEAKAGQAKVFFQKLGFKLELIPVAPSVSVVQATALAHAASSSPAPSNTISAKDFEVPGVICLLDESPEEAELNQDRRLLEIKRTPVLLVVFFLVITLGFYGIFWFLNRMEALNNLDSKSKLSPGIFQVLLISSGTLLVFRILDVFFDINFGIDLILFLVSLIVFGLVIAQAFKVRRILLDHFDANFSGLKVISGGLTLFLGIIFLQYKINGIHAWYQREEEGEIRLNGDGLAWFFAILFLFIAPVALISYSARVAFEEFDSENTFTESFAEGLQLGSYFAACEDYWKKNGDEQVCTKEKAGDSRPSYSDNPKVKVTGSGTRETFHAEAVYEGSESGLTINSQGEVGIKDGDETYVIDFDVK